MWVVKGLIFSFLDLKKCCCELDFEEIFESVTCLPGAKK